MPPTLRDFTARLEEQRKQQKEQSLLQASMVKQAAVKADLLMQHEGWDFFLTQWQAELEEFQKAELAAMELAATEVEPVAQRVKQLNYAIYRAKRELLESIIEWPSKWKAEQKQS